MISSANEGLPEIISRGQGGLLDVTLDPDFHENRWVYFSYSEPGTGGTSTAVARGQLKGDQLEQVQVIFSQQPKVRSDGHFGSRLVFEIGRASCRDRVASAEGAAGVQM